MKYNRFFSWREPSSSEKDHISRWVGPLLNHNLKEWVALGSIFTILMHAIAIAVIFGKEKFTGGVVIYSFISFFLWIPTIFQLRLIRTFKAGKYSIRAVRIDHLNVVNHKISKSYYAEVFIDEKIHKIWISRDVYRELKNGDLALLIKYDIENSEIYEIAPPID
ncbi:MAG: hypothetical protein K6G47_02470 [Clostridia bacterium]|nr:hypothetical protein [Clostridia bacterium]